MSTKKTNQISKDDLKKSKSLLVQDPNTLEIRRIIFPNDFQVGLLDSRFNSNTTLLGDLFVSSSIVVSGNITISGSLFGGSPITVSSSILLPTSKYLNFGPAAESDGYGVRDNAGTMQYKNSGDDWTNFGGGGGSSEWTDGGTYLRPSDNSGAEDVIIGGTTGSSADIILYSHGGATFNNQRASGTFDLKGLSNTSLMIADSQNERVVFLSGSGGATTPNETSFTDMNFFVSGSAGSRGSGTKGTSVFGGDLVVSGSVFSLTSSISIDLEFPFGYGDLGSATVVDSRIIRPYDFTITNIQTYALSYATGSTNNTDDNEALYYMQAFKEDQGGSSVTHMLALNDNSEERYSLTASSGNREDQNVYDISLDNTKTKVLGSTKQRAVIRTVVTGTANKWAANGAAQGTTLIVTIRRE